MAQQGAEHLLAGAVDPAVLVVSLLDEQPRTHHRRRGQRDGQRHENRHREGDGKLTKEPAHVAAHEQDGDKYRNERQADRQNREPDFTRALDRGVHRRLALLEMARDVLDHHDRIVDDEAGRHCQRHQREVVEAAHRRGAWRQRFQ